MGLFDGIEKLITEHGSAAILRERIALVKEEHAALEKKNTALAQEIVMIKNENQRLELENYKLKEKTGNLEKQLAQIHGKELEEEEQKIIALLARSLSEMQAEHIAAGLGIHPTRAEHFLDKLLEGGYVMISGDYISGISRYYLDAKGKEYAVKHGYV